jgi:acetyl-CoA acetyltransferase
MTDYLLRDRAAIAGIGMTAFTSDSGVSELALAAEATKAACADAGVDVHDLDAFATYSSYGEGVSPIVLAGFLGNPEPPQIYMNPPFGGNMTAMILGYAAMTVATGTADHVLVFRSFNGRSGYRMGGTGTAAPAAAGDSQWILPFGMHGAPANFAMNAREYVDRYGVREEDVGSVAVTFREHAQRNPHARMHGRPLTLDQYLDSRMIVDPFRLYDCCVEIDGAVALVVTTAERARDLAQPPVLVRAAAYGYRGMTVGNPQQQPGWHGSGRFVAPRLWERAQLSTADVDIAELCDDYTYSLLPQLEEYGWCGPGEAAAFSADGHLRLDGSIPTNTNGGQLSEGFMHGLNQVVEAVLQLRGDADERQVPGAEVALVTGTNGASAALLTKDR